MKIWRRWWTLASPLRKACARKRTFMWLMAALIGFTVRTDMLGVTSFVRALGLLPHCYDRLLDFFHSTGLPVADLTREWIGVVRSSGVAPVLSHGRLTVVVDGIKVAKEGRKMPAVKTLHQESASNTKPEFIMGHSLQAASLLVKGLQTVFAVPLAARIHEGVKFTNRDKRTLLDKAIGLLDAVELDQPVTLVVDAYYAAGKIVKAMLARGSHLLCRVKSNAVAWTPAPSPAIKKRGRPRIYGERVALKSLFDDNNFVAMESPYANENGISVLVKSVDLLWKPAGVLVRFVAVVHPIRGRCIFMCTDLAMTPAEILFTYALRFKIELSFKQALHVVGSMLYHFWMKPMTPIKRMAGTQHLHRKSRKYRDAIKRKIDAYHRFIQVGLIAQGLMQILACRFPTLVWNTFGSWLRTMKVNASPSEMVVAAAMKNGLIDFLGDDSCGVNFKKFLWERIDLSRSDGRKMAG